ncbi:hypothetical protein ACGF12_09430 [Kitasatospora sp. NPDC048296]|uniref:hypothetical protein n=1 Tax=Kitasatospora sp. NPDC048296 TaxID=3364048 RepID=UPI003723FCAF
MLTHGLTHARRRIRRALRDPVDGLGHVEPVPRAGYGPAGVVAPRRPARDTLGRPRGGGPTA